MCYSGARKAMSSVKKVLVVVTLLEGGNIEMFVE